MFLSEEERSETIRACRYCPMCHAADRIAELVRRESYTPRGRGAVLYALHHGLLEWDGDVADIMYTSLNDGLLREWCVGKYDHEELVLDARARLFDKGLAPEEVARFVQRLRRDGNNAWNPAGLLASAGIETHPGADFLLFAGSAVRESQTSTLVSMGKLFHQAGLAFQCLPDEPCCGWPLYQLGDLDGAKKLSTNLADRIRASGATTVVALDASSYRMLVSRTKRLGGDLSGIRAVHATGLLADWIHTGRIRITRRLSEPATYHDPCALARYCEELDSPRKILGAVLNGELKEMGTSGKLANCCGSGGMLSIYRPELAREVALLRLQEARDTGASILATGCPVCDATLIRARSSTGRNDPHIINIVDLVCQAAGLAEPGPFWPHGI